MPHLPKSLALEGPKPRAPVGNMDASLGKSGGIACGSDLAGEEFWPFFCFLWPQMSTAGNCNGFYIFFLVLRVFPVMNHPCQFVKMASCTTPFLRNLKRNNPGRSCSQQQIGENVQSFLGLLVCMIDVAWIV